MKVINFGSLNIDHVYTVDHIVEPGETISAHGYQLFAGGKGANQSVALARAGANVCHAGMVGPEGQWLIECLNREKVDTSLIRISDEAGGHAIIQVDEGGQNSILIFGGANRRISVGHVQEAVSQVEPGDVLLLQNEINAIPDIMAKLHAAGARIWFNPAPMDGNVHSFPLELVDTLVVNEHEGAALSGGVSRQNILRSLVEQYPQTNICLTLGNAGSYYFDASVQKTHQQGIIEVDAVDTTAAGDTFIGFLLAEMMSGRDISTALDTAARAAALSVTQPGAMASIPTIADVHAFAGRR